MYCKPNTKSKVGIVIIVVMFLVEAFAGVIFAQEEVPYNEKVVPAKEEKVPDTQRDINGVVVDMITGEPVEGATVSLLTDTVKSGPDGKFTLKDVKEYHFVQLSARITTDLDVIIGCTYFNVLSSYYPIAANKDNKLDVQLVSMLKKDDIVLRIAEYSKNNIDQFCIGCHETSPCLMVDEIGASIKGKKLRGVLVKQSELENYIRKMKSESITEEKYKNIRYMDTHPKGIDITDTEGYENDRIKIPDDLILKDDKIIACDTCHTRHVPTNWKQFVILDFMEKESICIKCHK